MADGFEQEHQDGGDERFDAAAFDAAFDDDGADAELEAAHERAMRAELSNLAQRHPELANEEGAARLVEAAADVAQEYGLSPDAASDPRFLAMVADHYDLGVEQQSGRSRESILTTGANTAEEWNMVLGEAARDNGLPFR